MIVSPTQSPAAWGLSDERGRPSSEPGTVLAKDNWLSEQIELAERRIGKTRAGRLRWWIAKAKSDLRLLRLSELEALAEDLDFYGGGPPRSAAMRAFAPPVTLEEVSELLAEGLAGLRAVVSGREPWTLPATTASTLSVSPDGKILLEEVTTTPREKILHALAGDVRHQFPRFRGCLACGEPFVPVQKQRFCSTTCAQTKRTERKREKRQTRSRKQEKRQTRSRRRR